MDRPLLVCVAPFLTPFRVQFFERIEREMPDVSVRVYITQNQDHGPWRVDAIPGIEVIDLGKGKPWQHASGLKASLGPDLTTAKTLISELQAARRSPGVRAILLVGYAYPSHLRLVFWAHKRVPLFLWGDSNILGDTSTGVRRFVKNLIVPRIVKRCAAILPCGTSGKQFFLRYGARPDHIFLCPADPDYTLIDSPDPALMQAVGDRYRVDPARKRIICCARLVELKRFDAAIDAFVRLAPELPEWDLLIVGDGEMRDAWQARVPLDLKHRVIWTGFIKNPAETAALYRWSHVFIHPGDYEAWGVVVLEAAAASLAMIVSNVVGAAPDLVKDGDNGRLVPPGDANAVEAALHEITQPANLDRMRAASRRISDQFRKDADAIQGLRNALRSV